MHSTSSLVRAATVATAFAMVPASAVVAQHHKGQHAAQHTAAAQHINNVDNTSNNVANKAEHAAAVAVRQPNVVVNQPARVAQQQTAAALRNSNALHTQASSATRSQSNAAMVSSLHSAMTQLRQADHDYDGHRGRAMREIGAAIRHLEAQSVHSNTGNGGLARAGNANGGNTAMHRGNGNHSGAGNGSRIGNNTGNGNSTRTGNGNGNGTRTGNGNGNGNGNSLAIPQAESDNYVRQAQQSLVGVESQMNTGGVNSQGLTMAKSSVQGAIRELNRALNDR